MVIVLVTFGGYSIGGYWWLVVINGYYISGNYIKGYWWSLMVNILMAIGGYFIGGY